MMFRAIFVSLVVILLFGTSFCQNNLTTTTTTTTTKPTPTTKPETTTKPTPTTKPETTTTTTTTTPPTTTTVKTSTTTPIPSNDTNWYVQNSNGSVCIAANLKADLKVTYTDKSNKSVVNNVSIPLNHKFADSKPSTCDNHGLQVLAFTINDQSIKNLSLIFNKTGNNVYVTRLEVNIIVTEDLFPNISKEALGKTVLLVSEGQHIFQVDNAHSYACDANQNYVLNVTQSGNLINKTEIVFENVKIQGFIENKKKEDPSLFSTESNCKGIQVSNLVPIVVGAALAGLVVIVLIAYFIGRRRSRRMAYQSV